VRPPDHGGSHSLPVHVDVTLRNAFNNEYQSFLCRYKFAADPVVLDPGRNLTVRVSSDF
jgi:hypothetical protein